MNFCPSPLVDSTLDTLADLRLLSAFERSHVRALCAPDGYFADVLKLAETVHLHIKVEDTEKLPHPALLVRGAILDHRNPGFVKYRFPGQINAIFSHIDVSQDDLLETGSCRRRRPFLDHIGIDLREETATVRCAFETLPQRAAGLGWPHVGQGGDGRSVYCCHVQVSEKRWLYPPDSPEHPGIPLEFAFGRLVIDPEKSGCDLRPLDPRRHTSETVRCCAQ